MRFEVDKWSTTGGAPTVYIVGHGRSKETIDAEVGFRFTMETSGDFLIIHTKSGDVIKRYPHNKNPYIASGVLRLIDAIIAAGVVRLVLSYDLHGEYGAISSKPKPKEMTIELTGETKVMWGKMRERLANIINARIAASQASMRLNYGVGRAG